MPIDRGSAAEREPNDPLVVAHVCEDRLEGREALTLLRAAVGYVDRHFYAGRARLARLWKHATCRGTVLSGVRKYCTTPVEPRGSHFCRLNVRREVSALRTNA